MEMFERVARALCLEAGLDPDRKFKSSNWGEVTAPHELAWHEFQPAARAAIEALREPTDAMEDAGMSAADQQIPGVAVGPIWSAMIDAVLNTQQT